MNFTIGMEKLKEDHALCIDYEVFSIITMHTCSKNNDKTMNIWVNLIYVYIYKWKNNNNSVEIS